MFTRIYALADWPVLSDHAKCLHGLYLVFLLPAAHSFLRCFLLKCLVMPGGAVFAH